MAVPENIRKVKRPVNTVIVDSGKDGPKRYAVRERSKVVYVKGKNPQPRNGRVIGHIVDYSFQPLKQRAGENGADMLSYGASAFVKSVSDDITKDLLEVFDVSDVYAIMAIASMRVCRPRVTAKRMASQYNREFVSVYYPGAAVGETSVGKLYSRLGMDGLKRNAFYLLRFARTAKDHHIAIDGMLKQDSSYVNDLSAFSYKGRVKGCKEVSVLYAYDIEKMEPICAKLFPGNSVDQSSYSSFIRDNDIKKGIIIADKGFPPSRIAEELAERPELHFITPIKRNDARIEANAMLSFSGKLQGIENDVLFSKKQLKGGRFLYAFRDTARASLEEHSYLKKKDDKTFRNDEYLSKRNTFGLIVFESDQDLEPSVVHRCYEDRWMLELVFRAYKNDECLDCTNVQVDFSVIGCEFVSFISTLMTCRLINKLKTTDLLKHSSFGEIMEDLSSAWRMKDAVKNPKRTDKHWVHTLEYVHEELEALSLSEPLPTVEHGKTGRKKKDPGAADKPRRPRGRPRKNPLP